VQDNALRTSPLFVMHTWDHFHLNSSRPELRPVPQIRVNDPTDRGGFPCPAITTSSSTRENAATAIFGPCSHGRGSYSFDFGCRALSGPGQLASRRPSPRRRTTARCLAPNSVHQRGPLRWCGWLLCGRLGVGVGVRACGGGVGGWHSDRPVVFSATSRAGVYPQWVGRPPTAPTALNSAQALQGSSRAHRPPPPG